MVNEMNLSGIVVHIHPACPVALRGLLADLSGVEIHTVREDGKMVISVEDALETAPAEMLQRVQSLPDVLSADMIYSYLGSMQNSVPYFHQGNEWPDRYQEGARA
ncbi:MAG: periplasmic nitrate reductase chaperone NapD [Candidatus Electronema aureum]|uniref:Chaperone NapD n=1 Tax=Candidatus Electronema aureum TaxID=2005002 RepID=A0A521G3B3_9BACT|nr:MAG: periplasmic nitrate reductase chaperone NapD [Candidatus Electronema aureum]